MTAHTELYKFTEFGEVDPFTSNQNLCFVFDKSGQMNELVSPGVTRFQVVVAQLKSILDEVNARRIQRGITVHIRLIAFSSDETVGITRRTAGSVEIAELKSWMDTLIAGGNASYDEPLVDARTYFLILTPADFRQSCFFIVHSPPEPVASAITAASNCADMIGGTGAFTVASGNNVDVYCMGVDNYDRTYLALLDNTPRDSIPVLSSTNFNALRSAILNAPPSNLNVWTFTSGDTAIIYNSESYIPTAIGRTAAEVKNEISRSNIDVSFSLDNQTAQRWLHDNVETIVSLIIYERDAFGEFSVMWKGRLAGVRPSMSEIKLTFESLFTSLRRPGLRASFQRSCRHMLYGQNCGVSKSLFSVPATPTAMIGKVVTIPEAAAHPDGYFTTGMLEGPDGALRFITGHTGDQITLVRPFDFLARAIVQGLPTSGNLYPGCDRMRSTCSTRYNNLNNYGGFDWIPIRNPFDGSSII
jgi:uncharacterized phage protein (TIGR02218 family)